MRGAALVLALVAALALLGGGVTLARSIGGGPGPDRLVGAAGNDTLRGFGGADKMRAKGGEDVLRAGSGDVMHGSLDGEKDSFFCGAGTDTVEANDFDEVAPDCEKVSRR